MCAFSTSLETVKKEIPATTKRVRFTAGLRYNEQQELVRPVHPDLPEYVGTPSPEVDAAWKDLMGGKVPKSFFKTQMVDDKGQELMGYSGECVCHCGRGARA